MEFNPVRWFEIYVQDMDRARAFYQTVFGFELQELESPVPGMDIWAFPMQPGSAGCGGALVKMPGAPSGGNSTIVYFSSEDCAKEAARIQSAGGQMFKEKMSIGQYGFIVLAYDTEGNMFGVHSMG